MLSRLHPAFPNGASLARHLGQRAFTVIDTEESDTLAQRGAPNVTNTELLNL